MLSHQENILEAPWQELVRHRMAGRNPCYPCLRRSQHMVLDGILWGAHLCSGRQANWDCPHSGSLAGAVTSRCAAGPCGQVCVLPAAEVLDRRPARRWGWEAAFPTRSGRLGRGLWLPVSGMSPQGNPGWASVLASRAEVFVAVWEAGAQSSGEGRPR